MAWTSSRGPIWRKIGSLEDLKAVLADIDDRNRCARIHAEYGSRTEIKRELTEQKRAIDEMHQQLCAVWDILHAAATADQVLERAALLEGER